MTNKRAIPMAVRSNKGFSLIELLVVAAIIIVAASVGGNYFLTAYRARSYQATKTVDGFVAQSKINAMSGKKNCLIIRYDESEKCYKCGLHSIGYDSVAGAYVDSADAYEYQDVGNDHLHILCGPDADGNKYDLLAGGFMRLEYNMDTGKVKKLTVTKPNGSVITVLGSGVATTIADIDFEFYSNHNIKIYKSTGEHEYT